MSVMRKPATSRDTPTTVTIRAAGSGSLAFASGLIFSTPPLKRKLPSGSRRNVSPTPLPFGHSSFATDSDTIATGCSSRSNGANARPRTMLMPSTSKYADDTCL
jgi:hypothetical protein